MKIIDSKQALSNIQKGWALTIGNFDGIHLGHQEILRAAKQAAKKFSTPGLALMTFHPHPAAILSPDRAPGILTPLELKTKLLEKYSVDCLIVIKDSFDLLNLSPQDFVNQFLLKTVKPAVVIEGPNFNFGYGRSGSIETLKSLSAQSNFEVIVTPAKLVNLAQDRRSVICSSSMIRDLLETGRIDDANTAMGRYYRLIGQTISGRGVGKEIGYPTANIHPAANQVTPAEGVYAGFAQFTDTIDDVCIVAEAQPAALSIGRAKTFVSDHPLMVEAHILEENIPDLTGKFLAMDFVKKIRSQKRFDSKQALKEQIEIDCKKIKTILAT